MTNNNKQNLYPVQVNDLFGYSDADGNIVIPCKWSNAENFSNGKARVQDVNGVRLYINKQGEIIR